MSEIRYKFTDKEIDKIKKSIVILVDTKEQRNEHIISFFDKKKIPYKMVNLNFGDYSCMIPRGTIDRFTTDIYFDRDFVIERKADIDELASNLKDDSARLRKELAHLNMYQIRFLIYIEDLNFEANLRNGNFRSKYDPKTLMSRLYKTIECEYNTTIVPVDKSIMGSKIYNRMQSCVHTLFKHKGFILEEEGEEID